MLYGRGQRLVAISLAIAIMAMAMPLQMRSATPHAIFGYVQDLDARYLEGATVFLNKTSTGESLSVISDIEGRYSMDIDGYPSGYATGDVINVTAAYHRHRDSRSLVVNEEPTQRMDMLLPFRQQFVKGFVEKPDGAPATSFEVGLANVAMNETMFAMTDGAGWYSADLSMFSRGYSDGDDLAASVSMNGYVGSGIGKVTGNATEYINISLADVHLPNLSVHEAPDEVGIGLDYRVLAWAIDNHKVASVSLFIRKEGEPLFSEMAMARDDGSANDWDGNGLPTNPLYGQSTGLDLDVQTGAGDLLCYLEVIDFSGNSATVPSSDPQSNPLRLEVADVTGPVVTHAPVSSAQAGFPIGIIAGAADDLGVDSFILRYRPAGGGSFVQMGMAYTGDPGIYNATIPPQLPGTLEYHLNCSDEAGNFDRQPAIGNWAVQVADTLPPEIAHTLMNSAPVNAPIDFVCRVEDKVSVSSVWLNFTDVHGLPYNVTMAHDTANGTWRHSNSTGQDATGVFHYTIWAQDASGNLARLSHAFLVVDPDFPTILHEPPQHAELGMAFNITAYVEDNLLLGHVNITYTGSNGTQVGPVPMSSAADPSADSRHGNFTASMPAQAATGAFQYTIEATDGSHTMTWPSVNPPFRLQVMDTRPPALGGLAYSPTAEAATPAEVRVNVTDAGGLDFVRLGFLDSTAEAWEYLDMSESAPGTYQCEIPPHPPGRVLFHITSNDTSGNSATLPEAAPKLNPFNITFMDTTLPEIHVSAPASLGVNRTGRAFVNVTDAESVTVTAQLSPVDDQGGAWPFVEVTRINGSFACALPSQNRSGVAYLYVEASDGTNLNSTGFIPISIVNSPPRVEHIGVQTAPLGQAIAFLAHASDDLRVESVVISWREIGDLEYTNQAMAQTAFGIYRSDLAFTEALIIQYRITALDGEGSATSWPPAPDLFHELNITDLEAPVISHSPPQSLNTSYRPLITARATDNHGITAVRLSFRNSTSQSDFTVPMSRVAGTDNYTAILGLQPPGELTYRIEATDGINTATSPAQGNHTVVVEDTSSSAWAKWLLLALTALLLALAIAVAIVRQRRKSI